MHRRMLASTAVLLVLPAAALLAQARPVGQTKEADAEFMRTAESGAPEWIARDAAIARLEPGGKVSRMREGRNGFTCTIMPDGSNAPVCADRTGFAWLVAAAAKQPKPPAGPPGVAYMAKGGVHHETPEGRIVMEPSGNTKEVKEPPHWMLLYPVDSTTSGIPTRPNAGGTYIMFAGTPYAHLMVYQDPKMLKP